MNLTLNKTLCVLALLAFVIFLGCSEEDITDGEDEVIKPPSPFINCYPSGIGSSWQYQDDIGNTSTRKIIGTAKHEGITYKMLDGEIGRFLKTADATQEPELFRPSKGGIRLYSKEINELIVALIAQDFQQLQGLVSQVKITSAINEWLIVETPLKDGNKWKAMLITASGDIVGLRFTLTIEINCQAAKRKTIEVPAGSFECIKLTYTSDSKLEIQNEAPSKYSETMLRFWLAEDVGIVQIEEEPDLLYKLVKYEVK